VAAFGQRLTGHWSIENSLWVRDVTFDEDRSRIRTGTLPRILATLRNLAIGIIRHATYRTVNIAADRPTPDANGFSIFLVRRAVQF